MGVWNINKVLYLYIGQFCYLATSILVTQYIQESEHTIHKQGDIYCIINHCHCIINYYHIIILSYYKLLSQLCAEIQIIIIIIILPLGLQSFAWSPTCIILVAIFIFIGISDHFLRYSEPGAGRRHGVPCCDIWSTQYIHSRLFNKNKTSKNYCFLGAIEE